MPVVLHRPGESHARKLIAAGDYDDASDWSLSAEEENALLGDPPDWEAYGAWHMGHDDAADREAKTAWKYPFGKNGKVYRSALRAIRTRAAQQNESDIFDAAGRCMEDMDRMMSEPGDRASMRAVAGVGTVDPRSWYRIVAQADPSVAELLIFDEIGTGWFSDGVTAKQFLADLSAIGDAVKTIRLRINSPGGSVVDALGIANALRTEAREKGRAIDVSIEGLAASAATIVTSAGDTIRIADNALMMIHDPIGMVIGAAADMRKTADELDGFRDAIIATYRWVSPLSAERLSELMAATTWMDAAEAVANGFATEVVSGARVAARFRPEALKPLGAIPDRYRARLQEFMRTTGRPAAVQPPVPAPATAADPPPCDPVEVLRLCREADCGVLAEPLLAAHASRASVEARLTEARKIVHHCRQAKLPQLAPGYLLSQMPLDLVTQQLQIVLALRDPIELEGELTPTLGRPRPVLDVAAIYRERRDARFTGRLRLTTGGKA